jgi:ATP-dependent DNA helicase DinG
VTSVKTFDPDDDSPEVDPLDDGGRQLDRDDTINTDRVLEVLADITAHLPGGGELREGQQAMAVAVAEALGTGGHLVVEAGTGVGKSLAYLVPAALSRRRVVIATATKNLQDQLAKKDAPAVAAVTGRSVTVLKGWSNYLCRVRVAEIGGGGQLSFDDDGSLPSTMTDGVRRLVAWAETTETGERDEAPFDVNDRAWRAVSVTPQECRGRANCPKGAECFAGRARDRAATSDLIVVNAHLYASHLATGHQLLPAHDHVIFDEAHEVQDIFASMLGTSFAPHQLRASHIACRALLGAEATGPLQELERAADQLEAALADQLDARLDGALGEPALAALGTAGAALTTLSELLRALPDDDARSRALGPATHLLGDIDRLLHVRTSEVIYLRRDERQISINLALIEVGDLLAESLWPEVSAVLTSATIPTTLTRELGLPPTTREITVDSPFNYREHALLYVAKHLPDRNDESAEAGVTDEIVQLITAAGGRTLALFTNRAVMQRVAEAVKARVETPILVQGTLNRAALTAKFAADEHASLFAVASYWQGVDVQGPSLSVVVIDRLPFRPVDDPVAMARRERSDNPFMEVDLPRAAMMLAQGAGRLIRSTTDQGVVAVLDPRLATKGYRHVMLAKLPPMKRTVVPDEVYAFLRAITAD